MSIVEDIDEAQQDVAETAKERVIYPATISSVTPLTVILDGSGVAVPCLAFSHATLKEGRRVGVIKVGADYVVFGTFGTHVLTDLTVDNDAYIGDDLTVVGDINWGASATGVEAHLAGPISNLSASFVYLGLWVPFVAPPSGKVNIHWSGRLYIGVLNAIAYVGYELRTGSTNGGGSVVSGHSASIERCIEARGAANMVYSLGRSKLATGLTPNASYHIRIGHGSSDASGATESSNLDVSVTMEI